MSKKRVLHISNSALSGAPGNLSRSLNKFSEFKSSSIVTGNPRIELQVRRQSRDSLFLGDLQEDSPGVNILRSLLLQSNIVHVHNSISSEALQVIYDLGVESKAKFIYQIHSPIGEPPFWSNMDTYIPLNFSARLAVAHAHPRMFQDFQIVPNIVFPPSWTSETDVWNSNKKLGATPVVSFAPSTRSAHRWSNKGVDQVVEIMHELESQGRITANIIEGFGSKEARTLMHGSDVIIDEVTTGGFHNVSVEGLSMGAAVINGADFLSQLVAKIAYGSVEPPPFISANSYDLYSKVESLIADPVRLTETKESSRAYYKGFMHPELTVQNYVKIYES